MRFLDIYLRKYQWWRKWRGLPEPQRSLAGMMITKEAFSILDKSMRFGVGGLENLGQTITIRKPARFGVYTIQDKEEHF